MRFSTIFAVFGLVGLGAAQVPPPPSSSVLPPPPPPPASVSTVPPTFLPRPTSTSSRSSRTSKRSSSSKSPYTTVTTVVSQFVTICAQPTTFYVGSVCYTATSANQPVTVTNCPCTVQSVCTTPYVAPTGTTCVVTGALVATSAAAQSAAAQSPPPVVITSAGPVGATATAKATSTQYVTAGGSKPTLMMSLMAFFMSLPLLAVFML